MRAFNIHEKANLFIWKHGGLWSLYVLICFKLIWIKSFLIEIVTNHSIVKFLIPIILIKLTSIFQNNNKINTLKARNIYCYVKIFSYINTADLHIFYERSMIDIHCALYTHSIPINCSLLRRSNVMTGMYPNHFTPASFLPDKIVIKQIWYKD